MKLGGLPLVARWRNRRVRRVSVQFTILGSGSGGNCAFLEAGETRLLIDAGFSAKQIRERLASIGKVPENLAGIIVTHEHGDHICGLGTLCGKTGTPIFANRLTCEAIQRQFPDTKFRFQVFETGTHFPIGDIHIQTFSVPHDAMDPVGFLLETNGGNIGFLTDLGHVTKLILERVRPSNLLILEANHDLKLLQEDMRRPWSTKQRILSRHGHLSNEAAANAALQLVSDQLRRIYLGHLSRDCNKPELAYKAVHTALESAGVKHVAVENTSQERPSPTVTLTEVVQARRECAAQQLLQGI